MSITPEQRLLDLGLTLPPAPKPGGVYNPVMTSGNMIYISGQPPCATDGSLIKGKLGIDMEVDEGYNAARQAGLTMLATLKAHFGELSKVGKLIKTLGMVNCAMDFVQQPQVINGFSEFMVEVLGEDKGKGARSAVGMILPGNIAVEVEAIFELA